MRKEDGRDRHFKFNYKDVIKGKNLAAEHRAEARRHHHRAVVATLYDLHLAIP